MRSSCLRWARSNRRSSRVYSSRQRGRFRRQGTEQGLRLVPGPAVVVRFLRDVYKRQDKSSLQLRKEVKRPAKEGNVSADRFTAGKTRNGLVDNCLENGSGKILFCCTVVDERLDIGCLLYTSGT